MAVSDFLKSQGLKGFLPLLVPILLSVTLTGCQWLNPSHNWTGQPDNRPKDVVSIFFSKAQGSQSIVEPVKRTVPFQEQAEPLPYAVKELLKGPTPEEKGQGFYSEIPKGTVLLGVHTKGETVTVDLSRQFESGGGSNSVTQRLEELKQTAYSVDNKHQLAISVEGKPLELLGGEGLEVPNTLKREAQ